MTEMDGDQARLSLGIDGTAGDAQDVPHRFWAHPDGSDCLVCGLAESYRQHREDTSLGEHVTRHIVVVDVETNGLDFHRHQAIEVAWWDLAAGDRGVLIPPHDPKQMLAAADSEALRINRYFERIINVPQATFCEIMHFHTVLRGSTLAGSNPSFDARMLDKMFLIAASQLPDIKPERRQFLCDSTRPWHHRLWDVSAYAAGVLGLDELPGLAKLCKLLNVEPGDHTAEADVTAAGTCLLKLFDITKQHKTDAGSR